MRRGMCSAVFDNCHSRAQCTSDLPVWALGIPFFFCVDLRCVIGAYRSARGRDNEPPQLQLLGPLGSSFDMDSLAVFYMCSARVCVRMRSLPQWSGFQAFLGRCSSDRSGLFAVVSPPCLVRSPLGIIWRLRLPGGGVAIGQRVAHPRSPPDDCTAAAPAAAPAAAVPAALHVVTSEGTPSIWPAGPAGHGPGPGPGPGPAPSYAGADRIPASKHHQLSST